MSEMDESSLQEPMSVSAHEEQAVDSTQYLNEVAQSLDEQAYFVGEIPQQYKVDPQSHLPLNSEKLIGSVNVIEKNMGEFSKMMEEEIVLIQKFQKKINFWEERIEKNKAQIQKNLNRVRQNNTDISYDKKNRDYWISRAEQVEFDFRSASAANRANDWAWLIKKYGLKMANGTEINCKDIAVEELSNGEISNLSGQYRAAAGKYDQAKKDREMENIRLTRENAAFMNTNDQLQVFINHCYTNEIEPLQDGVLLIKESMVKFKALQSNESTYGELRAWAEQFLGDFLKSNPRVSQTLITEFRKLTSIQLPADHC